MGRTEGGRRETEDLRLLQVEGRVEGKNPRPLLGEGSSKAGGQLEGVLL